VREHICIRRPEYVAGSTSKPEVGVFTQTSVGRKPTPWGHIGIGERVWMKWTGGPVVAHAVISGFRQFENCSSALLRSAVSGFALFHLDDYWSTRPPNFDALAIYLEQEEWLSNPLTVTGRSHGSSWITLPDQAATMKWMTEAAVESVTKNQDPRGPRTARPSLRFEVFRRDGYTCQYCGRRAPEFPLHVDHIEPWSTGGRTIIGNLRTACSECNLGKSNGSA